MKLKEAIIFLILFVSSCAIAQEQKPNIVFILADDMGIGDISGLNPDSKIATPNIDKLLGNGMNFCDAHSASSVCTPTRYGILTGRYPWRTKLKKGVLNGYSKSMLKDSIDTTPALLQRNGYKTALIGKWHLGWNWALKDDEISQNDSERPYNYSGDIEKNIDFSKSFKGGPTDHGFDYFYGINASLDFPPHVFCENNKVTEFPNSYFSGTGGHSKKDLEGKQKMQRKGIQAENFDASKTLLKLTQHSVEYIKGQDSSQAFFLYVSFTAPHTPVLPRKEFLGTSDAGIYGDYIQELDWSVGQIIKTLENKGIEENTIIIFTADNGASRISFPIDYEEKYQHKPSRELRGRKGTLHEGGHHIPFIVQWENKIKPNSQSDATICLNDLYATCADLVDENTDVNQGVDSYSLLSLFKENQDQYKRTSTIYANYGGKFSIRKGDWKLDLNPKAKKRKLFNLREDRSEKNNLYGLEEYKPIEAELMKEISAVISNGRSTKGPELKNEALENWPQIYWLDKPENKKIKVFFLAGQSNMDGCARAYNLNKEDLERLEKAKKNVVLYYNHQKPIPLNVSNANEYVKKTFKTDQVFGPELFFGIELSEAYPDHQIILIKRSRGGMSLYGAWNPNWTEEKAQLMNEQDDPQLYHDFVNYAHNILKEYDKSDYELCGMLWVQGEADSWKNKVDTKAADTYELNLNNLLKGVRTEFVSPELPFIIFQVGNEKVVQAMGNIANNDENVSLIPQEENDDSDSFFVKNPSPIYHYTYESMKKIGESFFKYYQNDYAQQETKL